jgi:hypothetical protein
MSKSPYDLSNLPPKCICNGHPYTICKACLLKLTAKKG